MKCLIESNGSQILRVGFLSFGENNYISPLALAALLIMIDTWELFVMCAT